MRRDAADAFELLREAGVRPDSKGAQHLYGRTWNWIEMGHKYGYPWCCIRQFVLDILAEKTGHGRKPSRAQHPLDGRMMCEGCQAKLDRAWPNRPAWDDRPMGVSA